MKRLHLKSKFRKLDMPSRWIRDCVTTRGLKVWGAVTISKQRNKKKIFFLKIHEYWTVHNGQVAQMIKNERSRYRQSCSPTGRPWPNIADLYWNLECEGPLVMKSTWHRDSELTEKLRWIYKETRDTRTLKSHVMVSDTCRKNGPTVSLTGEL